MLVARLISIGLRGQMMMTAIKHTSNVGQKPPAGPWLLGMGRHMEPIYSLAFTFFLLTQSPTDIPPEIHAEREIAYYDREGGSHVKSMEDCRVVAARRKERAEEAIRNSPQKLFADRVEVTCFEYERPKVAQRSRK